MADLLPDAPPPRGAIWPRTSGLDYEQYRNVHESHLESLEREGIVVAHSISFRETRSHGDLSVINVVGTVRTASGALIKVDKWLTPQRQGGGPYLVRTHEYDYHVRAPSLGLNVVRYDNAHGDVRTLHRHRYDCDGVDCGSEPIALDRMPPLSDVVREADFLVTYLNRRLSN